MALTTKPPISKRSTGYNDLFDEWRKIRDVLAGERTVKLRKTRYLPKPTGQNPEQYKRFVARANFYGVAERTLIGLLGLAFRVPPVATDMPAAIEAMQEIATPDGFSLTTLAKEAVKEVVSVGRFGLLVDLPESASLTGETVPYIATYYAENIWRWEERFDRASGRRILTRVVLEERDMTEGIETTSVLRELYLDEAGNYTQQLWRKISAEAITSVDDPALAGERATIQVSGDYRVDGPPTVPQMNGAPLTQIPFWIVNSFKPGTMPQQPPMLALADMNLAHYRNSADYEQGLHIVAQPTPWTAANWGDGESKPTHIGSGTIWFLPKDGTCGMLEFTGNGLGAIEKAMKAKEERMAALGARLIQDQTRSNQTAETTRLHTASETSVLTNSVQNCEAALEQALKFSALWAGSSPAEIENFDYALNQDFFDGALSSQDVAALVKGWQDGAYSKQTLHENLQRGEIIPHDRDLEEEQELINAEAPDKPEMPVPGVPGQEDPEDPEAMMEHEDEEENPRPMPPRRA